MTNAITKRACSFGPLSFMFFLLIFFALPIYEADAQTPSVTANFTYPEFKITTTPEFPGMCNGSVEIKCNEIYDSYTWKNDQYGIEFSKIQSQNPEDFDPNINKAILTAPGKWCLTVLGIRDGVQCSNSLEFIVYDMKEPEQIKAYFENAGFYAIPIWREDILNARSGSQSSRSNCELQAISFKEGGNCTPFVEEGINDALSNFKPLQDFNSTSVFSTNGCLCYEGKEQLKSLESDFKSGDASFWAHQFFPIDEHNGFLFVKGRMPGDNILPNTNQRTHFSGSNNNGLISEIIAKNPPTLNEGYQKAFDIIVRNVYLPHPINGYRDNTLCPFALSEDETYITPALTSFKGDAGYIGYFARPENTDGAMEGTMAWFTSTTRSTESYQGFRFKENIFEGYVDEVTGELFEGFTAASNSSSSTTKLNITNPIICEGNCKKSGFILDEPNNQFKIDGGLNFKIKKFVKKSNADENTSQPYIYMNCIPNEMKSNNSISFLSPTKSIVSLPCQSSNCSDEITDIELTYGSVQKAITINSNGVEESGLPNFEHNLVSGLLFKFTLKENGELVEYKYSFNDKAYKNTKNEFYLEKPEVTNTSNFVYSLACDSYNTLYKLGNHGDIPLPKHINGTGTSIYTKFDDFAKEFKPFSDQFPKIGNEMSLPTNNTCLWCPSYLTKVMTQGYCETPEHIYVDKIAQVATVFNQYFGPMPEFNYQIFSYDKINEWEKPSSGLIHPLLKRHKWEEYLLDNPTVKAKLNSGNPKIDRPEYFRILLEELIKFKNEKSANFWNRVTPTEVVNITNKEIEDHLKREPQLLTSSQPFATKKKLVLEEIFKRNNFLEPNENSIIHLVASSNNVSEAADALSFLENKNIESIWNNFHNYGGLDNRTRIILAICGLINTTSAANPTYYPGIDNFMPNPSGGFISYPPALEADISNWKNLSATFKGSNTIKIGNLNAVSYKTLIPVQVVSPIEFAGQSYDKGAILIIPALQAKMMAKINSDKAIESTAWVALDIGFMYFGIGAARRAWSTANFARKAVIAADIVGNGLAIGGQLLSSNILTTEQKGYLQIAALVSSSPLIFSSFSKVNKVVDDMDALARNPSLLPTNRELLKEANGTIYEAAIRTNNTNGNTLGPLIDPEDGKVLAQIDDPANGMANRMANNVPGQTAGYACLTGDTPIPTKDGFTLLKDIKENDEVITTSNKSTKVISKIKNVVKSLIILTLSNGEQIKSSPDHIFYNDKQEYVVSQSIVEGYKLLNKDGKTVEVLNVVKKDTIAEVYDLITDNITYSAGKSNLLTGTCILRFIAENKATYPNLYNNYRALDKAKRAQLVQDLYEARKVGNEIELAVALNMPNGFKSWEKLVNANVLVHLRRDADFLKRFTDAVIPPDKLLHASKGDFTYDPATGTVSRMASGGHGKENIDFLNQIGMEYNVVTTYSNGVRAGNVPLHKIVAKRTGIGQSWFPDSWTKTDIEDAGKFVESLPEHINLPDGQVVFGTYKGVKVGIIKTDGKVGTIFPDNLQ